MYPAYLCIVNKFIDLAPPGSPALFQGFNSHINAHFVAVLKTICYGFSRIVNPNKYAFDLLFFDTLFQ